MKTLRMQTMLMVMFMFISSFIVAQEQPDSIVLSQTQQLMFTTLDSTIIATVGEADSLLTLIETQRESNHQKIDKSYDDQKQYVTTVYGERLNSLYARRQDIVTLIFDEKNIDTPAIDSLVIHPQKIRLVYKKNGEPESNE